MNILIVDDVGYSLRSLEMVLEGAGHKVIRASNGSEAISTLKADPRIQAVITDLLMPDMDGVELFVQAQQLERTNSLAAAEFPGFILLTSAQEGRAGMTSKVESRLQLAQDIGFVDVLYKPLDSTAMFAALDRVKSHDAGRVSGVLALVGKIQSMVEIIGTRRDEEAATGLLQCLEEQGQLLREVVASDRQ